MTYLSPKILAYGHIRLSGNLPMIQAACNLTSIIDHGIGDYELVFEEPVSEEFHVQFSPYGKEVVFVDPRPHQVGGGARVPSVRILLESPAGVPIDADFDIMLSEYVNVED